jgi:hypothetical protein
MKASYNLAPLLIAELPISLTNNGLYPAVKRPGGCGEDL